MTPKETKDILVTQARIEGKIDRLVADAESEKATRKRRNDSFDQQLKEQREEIAELKEWKSNIQGRMIVAGIIWAFLQALVIMYLSKK